MKIESGFNIDATGLGEVSEKMAVQMDIEKEVGNIDKQFPGFAQFIKSLNNELGKIVTMSLNFEAHFTGLVGTPTDTGNRSMILKVGFEPIPEDKRLFKVQESTEL